MICISPKASMGMVKKGKTQKRARAKTKRRGPQTKRRKKPPYSATPPDQFAQSRAALEAAQSELESFCYSVSHDLRAPLRCIDGFSHALLHEFGGKLEPQAREYLDRVVEATHKMSRLIDELLAISRLQRVELFREDFNLAELANEVAARLEQKAPDRKVVLKINPNLAVNADRKLAATALEKLLENAWKFTSRTTEPRIRIDQTGKGSEPVFFIRDNGVGFDMENAGKLFKAFQRLHSQTDYPGLGTGLAFVRGILRRHGGRIWAESALGDGATFYFTFGQPAC